MKPAILVLIALMISVAQGLRSDSADAKLSIRLRPDGAAFSLHGSTDLEIIRENTGASPLLVCRQWGWGIGRTEVHVLDATGSEVHTDFMADELPPPPQPYDFVLLSPGDFVGTRLDEPAKNFVTKPGDYEVFVRYTSYLSESYAREVLKMPDKPFWSRERGAIDSNKIKVHVAN